MSMMPALCRIFRATAATLALSPFLLSGSAWAAMPDTRPGSDVAAPAGYRLDHYRAPTPAEAPGAVTLTTDEAEELHSAGTAVFIDVLRIPRYETAGLAGRWLLAGPHETIPGAVWLPMV